MAVDCLMVDQTARRMAAVSGKLSNFSDFPISLSVNMSGLQCLASESVWFDKHCYDAAEKRFYEGANGPAPEHQQVGKTKG